MRIAPRLLLLILCASVLLAPAAFAEDSDPAAPDPTDDKSKDVQEDVVVLKSGVIWSGRVIQEDAKVVVLETTSSNGGLGRITFDRAEVKTIRHGRSSEAAVRGGPRRIRDEWFLLRSGGGIVGTRHLELWSDRMKAGPGFRIEETIDIFSQGAHLPATMTKRTELVDLRFYPRLIAYREVGEAGKGSGGPKRYERNISGNVVDGVWRASDFGGGRAERIQLTLPDGARGRLGFREYLLRLPRAVRLIDANLLDPEVMALVTVRAGFTSVTADSNRKRPGHEFHWEEGDLRLISYFHEDTRPVEEEIANGVMALPVTREQAEAASADAGSQPKKEGGNEVTLPEPGIAFTPPGPIWRWHPELASPGNTGWRRLGRLENRVSLADARLEWHPRTDRSETDARAAEAWLMRRLRGASPDLKVVVPRRPMQGIEGAWRLECAGTLKKERIRTIAVVVDRPAGRVVLLLAVPASAREQVAPALERLLSSIRLL